MLILQIRGTSGSGKTTAMREIIGGLDLVPIIEEGRRKPIGYYSGSVCILGHYESTCGGCDNVGSARSVFDLIQRVQSLSPNNVDLVLCEGLLLSQDVKWTTELKEIGHDVRVLFLNTDTDKCIEQVKQRRLDAGNDKPLNTHNTIKRVKLIERARTRLRQNGVYCRVLSFKQVVKISSSILSEVT